MKNTYEFGQSQAIESNQVKSSLEFKEKDKVSSIRDAYSFYLSKLIKKDKKLILVDADLGTVAKTLELKNIIKNRYIQVGIAEQNAIGIAAGVAQFGMKPIVQSLAVFLTGRAFDQIRESISYSSLNVKLVGLHSGFTLSPDGATHQTGEDIALMSSLPDMEIFAPADSRQLKKLLPKFLNSKKAGYLRLFFPKAKNLSTNKFVYKKMEIIKKIQKINIISYGYILQNAIKVQEMLQKLNIQTGLINFHCLKPIDKKGVIALSKKSKLLIVVEDHNQFGGLGSQISQILSEKNPTKIISIHSNDKFGTTGLPDENLEYLGLSARKIFEKIKKNVKKK